jgi:putative ABC transport system permease protein
MPSVRVYLWRLLELVSFRRREARLSEEIEAHLALLTEHYRQQGLSPEDARLAARREFGAVAPMTEQHRDQRGLPWFDALALDARFACRLLARDRAFTATVVLVLGLGIGVNNMLFTILYAHTLRGLPIAHAERIAHISLIDGRGSSLGLSRADFDVLTATSTSFEGLAAFTGSPVVVSTAGQPPERLEATHVTPAAFPLLGGRPLLGRLLNPDDARDSAPPVALLSRAAWAARYGGDAGVIGRAISIDDVETTIVGVLPDRPPVPGAGDVWLPLGRRPTAADAVPGAPPAAARVLRVVGRLRDGATFEAAAAEMSSIVGAFAQDPSQKEPPRPRVTPIDEIYFGNPSDPVWLAFMSVGVLVLLISCANVANLLLGRALGRAREIAMRLALGASRGRVVRQLLIESCVLATLGGAVGLGLSIAGIRAFRSLIPENVLPWWFDYSIDVTVCGALVGVSLATVIVFGLVPALHASRTDVNHVLKDAGGRSNPRTSRRWTTVFLTGELALTVVMLANLAHGLRASAPTNPAEEALQRSDALTAKLEAAAAGGAPAQRTQQIVEPLLERLRAVRGIDGVSLTSALPSQPAASYDVEIEGRGASDDAALRSAVTVSIGPRYFETLGLPMPRGREFSGSDGATPLAIVNARFVERHFGDGNPLGKRIALKTPGAAAATWYTIVGVSPAIRQRAGPRNDAIVYAPWAALPVPSPTIVMRSTLDPAAAATFLRREVLALDRLVVVDGVRSLRRVIADALWNGRVASTLLNAIVVITVLLAVTGLYAVTMHAVNQRAPEIGLRVALGASRLDVARVVLRRVLWHVALGFCGGTGLVLAWSRAFPSGQAGVSVFDPATLGLVAAALVVLALVAALAPLRRAIRVDPLTAIRTE